MPSPLLYRAGLLLLIVALSAMTGRAISPAGRANAQDQGEAVSVNQHGYLPDGPKFGARVDENANDPAAWQVVDAETGATVAEGTTRPPQFDRASQTTLLIADFSSVSAPGTYQLVIDGVASAPFRIGTDLYTDLKTEALRYFYLNRSGIALQADYAGMDYSREAGHLSDAAVTCYAGTAADGSVWDGCDYTLDASGGWYDAGDYGKYVVNGGISVWTLLNLYERFPDAFPDGSLRIPESGDGVPDILNEARWEIEWLLAMQVPAGAPLAGMAHHKLHGLTWDPFPSTPRTEEDDRYLMPPSTAATLNLAAAAAQAARIWADFDAAFADRCLTAARTAYDAALANPALLYGNVPGEGGGNYGDPVVVDEFFWAAAELFITTGDVRFADDLAASGLLATVPGLAPNQASAMSWNSTAALGALSLVLVPVDQTALPDGTRATLAAQIVSTADAYLRQIEVEGFRVPLPEWAYWWGSNSGVLNNAIILAYAHDLTGEARYRHGVQDAMNYLLGYNTLAFSYISGYGERAMAHPHHRFWANDPNVGYPPPPPGVVAGGPNADPDDPTASVARILERGPAGRYIDNRGSWSTNEVTINWNAPLVWVATYLDRVAGG